MALDVCGRRYPSTSEQWIRTCSVERYLLEGDDAEKVHVEHSAFPPNESRTKLSALYNL